MSVILSVSLIYLSIIQFSIAFSKFYCNTFTMSDKATRKRGASISSSGKSIKRSFLKLLCRPTEAFSTLDLQETLASGSNLLPSVSRLSVLPNFASSQYRFQTPEPVTPSPRSHTSAGTDVPFIRYSLESLRKSRDTLRSSAQARSQDIADKHQGNPFREDVPPNPTRRQPSHLLAHLPTGGRSRTSAYYKMKSQALSHLILNGDGPEFFHDLNRKTKSLFESFCIQDLQLPRHPVALTSADLLPPEEHRGEGFWYLNDSEVANEEWQLSSIGSPQGTTTFLIIKEDLIERETRLTTHRFTSQIDITPIIQSVGSDSHTDEQDEINPSHEREEGEEEDEDEDVWLTIAQEDMGKRSKPKNPIHQSKARLKRSSGKTASPQSKDELDVTLYCIRLLYKYFFVVSGEVSGRWNFNITHVSRDLIGKLPSRIQTLHNLFPSSATPILQHLSRGTSFALKLEEENRESGQILCGVPLFGPSLNCWLCFIIGRLSF